MKKLQYIMLTFLFCCLLAFSSLAASGQISFSDPKVTAGEELNVTMKIKSGDSSLSSAELELSYDSSLLEFESGTDASGGEGSIHVSGAGSGAGSGTLEYNFRFRTLGSGETTINVVSQQVTASDNSQVEINHLGSSAVTVLAESGSEKDATLKELSVSPGELSPAFSSTNTDYSLTVGTDVSRLTVNAVPSADSAKVEISGNDSLNMGENHVTVNVSSSDGSTTLAYNLKVTKQEGGASQKDEDGSKTTNEGVKLSAKEKTITIMNPGSDVKIPDGFAESKIDIDGHQVRGWVWKEDTEHPYCIVYGMNDAGELNFYRYDLSEKTIQRYFLDPVAEKTKQDAEAYAALVKTHDSLVLRYNWQFILSCVLALLCLSMAAWILLKPQKGGRGKAQQSRRELSRRGTGKSASEPSKKEGGKKEELSETRVVTDLGKKEKEDLEITRMIQKTEDRDRGEPEVEELDLSETRVLEKPSREKDSESGKALNIEEL